MTGFLSHDTKGDNFCFSMLTGHMTRPELIHCKPHSKNVPWGGQGRWPNCFTPTTPVLLARWGSHHHSQSQPWSAPESPSNQGHLREGRGRSKCSLLGLFFWAVYHLLQQGEGFSWPDIHAGSWMLRAARLPTKPQGATSRRQKGRIFHLENNSRRRNKKKSDILWCVLNRLKPVK